MKNKTNKIALCKEDKVLYTIVTVLMILLLIAILYPLIYVVSSSFSSASAVSSGRVILWPVEPTLKGYEMLFHYKAIWTGYKNTIIYTIFGTLINVTLTTMVAYPLSRKNFQGKLFLTVLFLIPMFFNGGMIPEYVLMSNLHLTNTRWAILLSWAISTYNVIVMKTFFQNSIPEDLYEAAVIDGISDIGYLFKIVMPLSKAIFAVITLYYAVGHWNAYFGALMYIRDSELQPLQIILRNILNAGEMDLSQITDAELLKQLQGIKDVMENSLIVVSSIPILVAYPFVQKFFEKGVMIGSVKG